MCVCVCEHSDRKQLLSYEVLSLLLIIYNITAFTVSGLNTCSIGEQKSLLYLDIFTGERRKM